MIKIDINREVAINLSIKPGGAVISIKYERIIYGKIVEINKERLKYFMLQSCLLHGEYDY